MQELNERKIWNQIFKPVIWSSVGTFSVKARLSFYKPFLQKLYRFE